MPEQVLPTIESRRARRAITDQPIDRKTLEILLKAAQLAPSCANNQPWRFVIVEDKAVLDQLKEHLTGGNYWAKVSPAIIAVASRVDLDCQIPDGREYHLFGCGMATGTHSTKNLPLLLAGGGFKLGQHMVLPEAKGKRVPAANLLLSILQNHGLEIDRFGTSTGTLNGLERRGA